MSKDTTLVAIHYHCPRNPDLQEMGSQWFAANIFSICNTEVLLCLCSLALLASGTRERLEFGFGHGLVFIWDVHSLARHTMASLS